MTSSIVIARSQRVRPEVAGPMTSSAKQSTSLSKRPWIASLTLAMTQHKSLATRFAPELCQGQRQNRFASGSMIPKVVSGFRTSHARKEGGGAPKGASNQFRAAPANVAICRCPGAEARHADKCTQSAHLSACGARSPSGATPRLSPGLSHPGSAPGHACWDRSGQAFYPPFPVPSPVEAPHASAVVPKGMMPKAAPAQVASPRGSTALAPHFRSHPECVPR